jgi:dihydrolipoamide dehydrogenase
LHGKGEIVECGKVVVNDENLLCRNIILATGSKWVKPGFVGGDLSDVINTDELLNLREIPKRVLLFGSSPWLAEIGQFLCRFGCHVSIAMDQKSILYCESKAISSRLIKALKDEKIEVWNDSAIVSVWKEEDGLHVKLMTKSGEKETVVEKMICGERIGSLEGLGLRALGIREDQPYVHVNSKMETSVTGVYAAGDLVGDISRQYSHIAAEGGVVAAENAMGKVALVNTKASARVVFTDPQVVCVGLTPKEAKIAGYDVVVGSAPLSMNTLGMILSEKEGIVEVVTERRFGEVLGIHIVGRYASEMAGEALLAIQMEATVEDLARVSFPHPTLSESLAEAARDALGRSIYLP